MLEVLCLALNLYHEARGEPLKGILHVAAVTIKRKNSKHYPNTICGVVYQKHQFSWAWDKRSDVPKDMKSFLKMLRIASNIHKYSLNKRIKFYHSKHIKPKWAYNMRIKAHIGNHIFY